MNIPIRLKLFFSYVGIIFVSLTLVGWTTSYILNNHFNKFMRSFDGMHGDSSPFNIPGVKLFLSTLQSSLIYTTIVAGIIALIVSLFLSVLFTRPIKEVISATKSISKGNYKRRVNVHFRDELGELSEALNTMAASLEKNQRLQQELITTMIHELATPLTNITGYLEAISDGIIKGNKRVETLELIQEEAARLNAMVTEVRELSQVQNPNFAIHPSSINLNNLVKKVITQMKPQLKEKNLKVNFIAHTVKYHLMLDRDRMIQVLQNIINNAIRFSPANAKINILLKEKRNKLLICIADEGPGIPKEDLPHIFDRFYRSCRSRSRKTGGLGIGLTLAKEIIEAHGGKIKAINKPDKGSCFKIYLPLS